VIMDKVWPQTDSKEGMEILFEYARNAGLVLHEAHEQTAKKYGVDTSGVIIARAKDIKA
jgi:hypothetical protein